jgi:hypothetical protein
LTLFVRRAGMRGGNWIFECSMARAIARVDAIHPLPRFWPQLFASFVHAN